MTFSKCTNTHISDFFVFYILLLWNVMDSSELELIVIFLCVDLLNAFWDSVTSGRSCSCSHLPLIMFHTLNISFCLLIFILLSFSRTNLLFKFLFLLSLNLQNIVFFYSPVSQLSIAYNERLPDSFMSCGTRTSLSTSSSASLEWRVRPTDFNRMLWKSLVFCLQGSKQIFTFWHLFF